MVAETLTTEIPRSHYTPAWRPAARTYPTNFVSENRIVPVGVVWRYLLVCVAQPRLFGGVRRRCLLLGGAGCEKYHTLYINSVHSCTYNTPRTVLRTDALCIILILKRVISGWPCYLLLSVKKREPYTQPRRCVISFWNNIVRIPACSYHCDRQCRMN